MSKVVVYSQIEPESDTPAEAIGYVLDHGPASGVTSVGSHRGRPLPMAMGTRSSFTRSILHAQCEKANYSYREVHLCDLPLGRALGLTRHMSYEALGLGGDQADRRSAPVDR